MRAYIIRRLLFIIPTLFLVSVVIFSVVRLIPGDVLDLMINELDWGGYRQAFTKEGGTSRADMMLVLGIDLDAPLPVQYGRWIGVTRDMDGSFSGLLQGDFGTSLWKKTPVIDDIFDKLPVTLELGLLGLIVAQLIALPIGIYSALRQDTWGDYIGRSFAILCIAVPGFWLATLVIVFPSVWWGYMPSLIYIRFTEDPMGNLQMLILPAIVMGMAMAGMTMRLTRTMMLEVLRQDYIRTAWAKGLRERAVILRHALKNALIPVITMIGLYLPLLIGGTVIIEEIFGLPGMGRLMIRSAGSRDYPIVSATLLFYGVAMVLSNLLVDLSYAFLDPRVHYK